MSGAAPQPVPGPAGTGRGRFRHLRWATAGAACGALIVALAAALLPDGDVLFRENGVLEDFSVICWVLSCLAASGAALRSPGPGSRLLALWTGWMAGLAALRELDVHMWLNPQHLGAWGVRYRLDWWMSGDANLGLRLGWAVAFLTVGVLVTYPPWRFRRVLVRLVREGDAFAGLWMMSVVFLAFGFVIDDILRPVRFVSADIKQLIEETSETIGATLYLASMVLQWRMPGRIPADKPGQESAGSESCAAGPRHMPEDPPSV